jgi:hypothetical protein
MTDIKINDIHRYCGVGTFMTRLLDCSDCGDLDWYANGNNLAFVKHDGNFKNIEIWLNIDVPEVSDEKIFYAVYGYCKLHKYEFVEFGNPPEKEQGAA